MQAAFFVVGASSGIPSSALSDVATLSGSELPRLKRCALVLRGMEHNIARFIPFQWPVVFLCNG